MGNTSQAQEENCDLRVREACPFDQTKRTLSTSPWSPLSIEGPQSLDRHVQRCSSHPASNHTVQMSSLLLDQTRSKKKKYIVRGRRSHGRCPPSRKNHLSPITQRNKTVIHKTDAKKVEGATSSLAESSIDFSPSNNTLAPSPYVSSKCLDSVDGANPFGAMKEWRMEDNLHTTKSKFQRERAVLPSNFKKDVKDIDDRSLSLVNEAVNSDFTKPVEFVCEFETPAVKFDDKDVFKLFQEHAREVQNEITFGKAFESLNMDGGDVFVESTFDKMCEEVENRKHQLSACRTAYDRLRKRFYEALSSYDYECNEADHRQFRFASHILRGHLIKLVLIPPVEDTSLWFHMFETEGDLRVMMHTEHAFKPFSTNLGLSILSYLDFQGIAKAMVLNAGWYVACCLVWKADSDFLGYMNRQLKRKPSGANFKQIDLFLKWTRKCNRAAREFRYLDLIRRANDNIVQRSLRKCDYDPVMRIKESTASTSLAIDSESFRSNILHDVDSEGLQKMIRLLLCILKVKAIGYYDSLCAQVSTVTTESLMSRLMGTNFTAATFERCHVISMIRDHNENLSALMGKTQVDCPKLHGTLSAKENIEKVKKCVKLSDTEAARFASVYLCHYSTTKFNLDANVASNDIVFKRQLSEICGQFINVGDIALGIESMKIQANSTNRLSVYQTKFLLDLCCEVDDGGSPFERAMRKAERKAKVECHGLDRGC